MVEEINRERMNNRAQITIFIIFALIIVVIFIIIFLFLRAKPEIRIIDEKNPQAYIETCAREAVEEAVDILSRQGGDIYPRGFIDYKSEKVTYLCYNYDYYGHCTNKRPLLIKHVEGEIEDYVSPIIEECFNNLKNTLSNRYDIETSDMVLKARLQSKNIVVEIDKKFMMSREGSSRDIDEFTMHMAHPFYNLLMVAREIVNQEAKFCNFEDVGYMIVYPQYDINKFLTGDTNIIYTVTDRTTAEKFVFAVRSCVLPAGF